MGTGCELVTRKKRDDGKIEVVGEWVGGRVGTFREDKGYSGKAVGEKGEALIGEYSGYRPLVVEIVKFFKTRQPPVSEKETLEICAFIEADFESKRRGGEPVEIDEMLAQAKPLAEKRLAELGVK
jgi:hypothetical protein